MSGKVIISCAVTGSIHTPSMSPHLPVTPVEIASQAVDAAHAGASILHLHARDPESGMPTPDPEVFLSFLPEIHSACVSVINISTGGGQYMSVAERLRAAVRIRPEMCSLNMGSINFGLFPALEKPRQWQFEWEPKFLEDSRDFVFRNTFHDIETILWDVGEKGKTRFEFECYDVGHLYNLKHFLDRGLVVPPLFVQFIFGVLGGIGPDPDHLIHMKQTADKLFGDRYLFSVLAAGRHQMPMAAMGAKMGGNVRVGLEDSLYLEKGKLAPDNASQVRHIRAILEKLSLEIATPEETRRLLALKGRDMVNL